MSEDGPAKEAPASAVSAADSSSPVTGGTEVVGPVEQEAPAPRDRAVVLGPVDDKSFAILRQRTEDAPLEAGVVRPMREGEPIHGELVSLSRPEASSPVLDVKVHYDGRPKARAMDTASMALPHKGPARVTSEAFREGWDAVFRRGEPN